MGAFGLVPKEEAIQRMNRYGERRKPFFFLVSFDGEQCIVCPLDELPQSGFLFDFNGVTNASGGNAGPVSCAAVQWRAFPEPYDVYRRSFDIVRRNILLGNSFLLNLTCRTPISTNLSLRDIYMRSRAKYKLWWRGHFTMFSPEIFVKIQKGKISTYPMKGTVDAEVDDARRRLLDDRKEAAEHATITDLLRNDLSRIATCVTVERYRYVDTLVTHRGKLLQTSSEITGRLPEDFYAHLGAGLFELLPAGSVTGAPKKKTVEIIREAENYDRGFYTGVTGVFDGESLDSAVIIRYVEEAEDGRLFFKSGGGITFQSECRKEYEEMIEKIYVPVY